MAMLKRPAPVMLKQPTSTSSLHLASSLQEEGTSHRPRTATAKVVADWTAESGSILLLRQKVETTEYQPLRKVERYESKEVAAKEVADRSILDEWEEHRRTAPESYSANSEFNHVNWEKEKESRRQVDEQTDSGAEWSFPQFWHFLCIRT